VVVTWYDHFHGRPQEGQNGHSPPLKLELRTKLFLKICSEHLIQINWFTSCNSSRFAGISGVGRRGCKHTPKSFDVVKIREKFLKIGKIRRNLGKICENLCKTPENLGKLPEKTAKWRPTCFVLKKLAANVYRITLKFCSFKNGLHEKIFAQKVVQNFFGTVRGNSGKNPSHPKKFACSYTYGRYDPHIAQEAGLFLWCHVMMILQFTHVCFLVCGGSVRNLRADSCSS